MASEYALDQILFSQANPFWQQGESCCIEVSSDDQLVAFHHAEYLIEGQPFTAFGYLRLSQDLLKNSELFEKLQREGLRKGSKFLLGPLNFKSCYNYRLRLDHFDLIPFWGEPWQPPHYVTALLNAGFDCRYRYRTDHLGHIPQIRKMALEKLSPLVSRFDMIDLVPFSLHRWRELATEMLPLVNRIFSENVAFLPLTSFDFSLLYSEPLLKQVCPDTSAFIFSREQKLVGFSFHFPDPNEPRRLLIKTTGILPEYRHSGKTFTKLLYSIFAKSEPYTQIAFCLMNEGNMAHRLTQKHAEFSQHYGLFVKDLTFK